MTAHSRSKVRSLRTWLVSLASLAAVLLASLVTPPTTRASAMASPVEMRLEDEISPVWLDTLRESASEFGVPRDLLVVLGHLETRWRPPTTAAEGSDSYGGSLALNERVQAGPLKSRSGSTLRDAAALLGMDVESLESDPLAMLRGGAATLRAYRDDGPERAAPIDDLESWASAIRRFASYSHPTIAEDHLESVYVTLRDLGHTIDFSRLGLDGELAPVAFANPLDCQGYQHHPRPPVDLAQRAHSSNYEQEANNYPARVVLHGEASSFWGLMDRFASIYTGSVHRVAHYTVAQDGRLGMSVCENQIAYHFGGPASSADEIAIMHESFGAPTDAQYTKSARLVGAIVRQWGLSPDAQTIYGAGQLEGNQEPGVDWDWEHYLALVEDYATRPIGPQQPCAVQCGQTCVSPGGSSARLERLTLSLASGVRGELTWLGASDPNIRTTFEGIVAQHQAFFDSQSGSNPQTIGAAEIAAADDALELLQARGSAELAEYLRELRERLPTASGLSLVDGLDAVLRPGGGEEGGAPRAPENLRAIPIPGAGNRVELSWSDRSWNEQGFRVLRRLASGNWQEIATKDPDESFHEDVVPDLPGPGGVLFYFYKVVAYNDSGWTESNRAETRMYSEPPGKPDTLRPRGCIDTHFPLLTWNGHGRASRFYVRLLDLETNEPAMLDAMPSSNQVRASRPLRSRVPHMLRVWGMNNIGWGTGSAPEFFLPFCGEQEPPRISLPLPGCTGTLTPTVEWTPVDGALAYHLRIFRVTDIQNDPEVIPGGVEVAGTSWTVPAGLLAPGTTYRLKVKPHTGGQDSYSPMRFFTPLCSAQTIGVAAPLAPAGGVSPTSLPEFVFEPAAGAESYTLEVWTTTWNRVVEHSFAAAPACDGPVCKVRPAVRLLDGSYHWRQVARRGASAGIWGPWASFSVLDQPIRIAVSDAVAHESGSGQPVSITVELSRPSELEVRVGYRTVSDTAASPGDFDFASGTLVFAPGTTRLSIALSVRNDSAYELDEQFQVELRDAVGAEIGDAEARIVVHDDDPLPVLFVDDFSVLEGGSGGGTEALLRIRMEGATEVPASVTARLADCTATGDEDYLRGFPTIVRFEVGETEATIGVPILGDLAFEGDDTFLLGLESSSEASIGDGSGQGRIRNDDARGPKDPRRLRPRTDFDGDGRGDLLWRNTTSGRLSVWNLDGSFRRGGTLVESASFPSAAWTVVSTADFDRDGDSDILWRNGNSGRLALWTMTGSVHNGGQIADGLPIADWDLAGSADLDLDGYPDLVWRHRTSGALRAWLLEGLALRSEAGLSPAGLADLNWRIAALGDLDADGRDDLLWRHGQSGALVVWYMDGLTRRAASFLDPAALPDLGWQALGIWDVDDDGANDLVWRHTVSGKLVVWYLAGATRRCGAPLVPDGAADSAWVVASPL